MRTNDILWKGIIESFTEDFLSFFYPDEVHLFDLSKPFDYLDKELAQIISEHDIHLYQPICPIFNFRKKH